MNNFENAVYLIITVFGAGFMIFLLVSQLKKQEVKTKDEGCRYCYELSIRPLTGDSIVLMLYSDERHADISALFLYCSAIKDDRNVVQYRNGNQSMVIFKKNITAINMSISERSNTESKQAWKGGAGISDELPVRNRLGI